MAQVKDFIAKENKSFKIADVENLIPEAFNSLTVTSWCKAVQHTIKKELQYWESEGLTQSKVEKFVINMDSDSDSERDLYDDSGDSDTGDDTDYYWLIRILVESCLRQVYYQINSVKRVSAFLTAQSDSVISFFGKKGDILCNEACNDAKSQCFLIATCLPQLFLPP
ncbi:hypothetical protein KUTeg_017773 [Tegillarca granosa]|uniref:Uncharacterized protein n=1 Tax=Tegillarca granosa TaxID=220873 RepID=A0ABQ9EG63_TEGGR|nr:hypothetical protein KUTeg_017773 [Tegillarca granosa]